jgi:predicted dehydrogenase
LICAAPNHWHAPSTILACSANKHVYVEKPCCHNPREGELMIEAARKHNRAVQMGSQRRSGPGTIQAIKALHEGVIGRVYLARSWYNNRRGPIGKGKPTAAPKHLEYDLWQGPAPRVPYMDNRVHYNWHWFWHWGNGELGNNGIHTLDLCRWGLAVDYPIRVTSSGNRYHWNDDQQTPDTHTVCFEFKGKKQISWQGKSCNRHRGSFVTFYGTDGTLDLRFRAPFGPRRTIAINGLTVEPASLLGMGIVPPTNALPADGVTVDKFKFSGPANTLVTV